MLGSSQLQPINEHGWRCGLPNLLRKEFRQWWWSWLGPMQLIVWIAILDGMSALSLKAEASTGIEAFIAFAGLTTGYGSIGLAQGVIVREKRAGTLQWVLSGPVSRFAVIASKLVVLITGCFIVMLLVPGILARLEIALITDDSVPMIPMISAMGVIALQLLFFISLTVMLGTMFNSRGPVTGLPVAVYFVGMFIIDLVPSWIADITPWRITELALQLAKGEPLSTPVPFIAIAIWSIVFIVASIWRLQKEEF